MGEFHSSEQKVAGHEMENLLRNTDSTSITTMFPDSGPTYFSPQGTSRTLDHWVGPVGFHHVVEECRVLWQTGRRLQLIPAGLPRDRLPILLPLGTFHNLKEVKHRQHAREGGDENPRDTARSEWENGRTSGRHWRSGTPLDMNMVKSKKRSFPAQQKSWRKGTGAAPCWSASAELFLICASPSYF